MKYEVLKRSHLKRNIIIALIVVGMISAIVLNFTRAKYRTTESMPLLNGTINYTLADINIVAMYLDGSEIDTLPDGNYELTSESYCTTEDDVRDESIILSYDSDTKGLSVSPMTRKGTKCYLYFEERASAGETILASENAPTNHTTDWTGKESYYYTGNPDNWVSFAGFYWRIIRINGDGTIRVIYQGVADSETPDNGNMSGTGTQIGTSAFNSKNNNNMYVGFKYTSGQVHGTGTNSTILGASSSSSLNTWYNNNLANDAEYIDGNAGFCGDRTTYSGSGTGTSTTYYAAYNRLENGNNPSLQCDSRDVYTTTDSSSGNKSLTYPIGLLTADEYVLAGSWNSYLYTRQTYWTMSPSSYNGGAFVFVVDSIGGLGWYRVDSTTSGVRPVINLKADVQVVSGDGTASNPFVIAT